jgi:hypothetical protein
MKALTAIWVIGLSFTAAAPAAAGMYKWVDEKGATHYGDVIPPQYVERGHQQLNGRGVVVKSTAPALTVEQRLASKREEEARQAAELKAQEQKRRDEALLLTFTSAAEIDGKRDRDLQPVDLAIANAQALIDSLERKAEEQHKRAETFLSKNLPVPETLKQEIAATRADKQEREAFVAAKREERAAIHVKYETYRSRLIELKSGVAVR